MSAKVYVVVLWAVCMGLWGMSVWGGWADRMYERYSSESPVWYWLRLSRAEHTRENCVAFIRGISIAGMICVTFGVVATLIWGE